MKKKGRKNNKMGIPLEPNPALTTDFQHQLRIAKKLMEYADRVVTTEKPDDDPSRTDHQKLIAMALGGKGFRTFNAIIDLLEKGHADDATILSRALYECSLVAIYLLDAPEQVVEDYSDYFMYRNWRDHKLFSEIDPTTAAKSFSPDYLNTMRAQYELVADSYPDGRWTNLSIEAMAIAVDEKIPNGFKVFKFTYNAMYRQASAYVHSDIRSVQSSIVTAPGFVRRVVAPQELGKLMYLANFLMLTMCFVIFGSIVGKKFVTEHNAIAYE